MGFGREQSIVSCISPNFGVPLESSKREGKEEVK